MQRVRRSTAAASLPAAPTGGTPGYFANPNPGGGVSATVPGYEWFNSVQEELAAPIEGSGITLDGTKYNQLFLAIKRIFIKTQTLTDTGTANTYTAANTPALTLADIKPGLTQQVLIANTNSGASTYSPDGLRQDPIYGLGLQALQGGELVAGSTAILMSATIAGVNGGYPIYVLLECMGGAQQVPNGTKTQHAVALGQLFGGLKGLQKFTSSGSFTVPASVYTIYLSGCAAGGGGGGSNNTSSGNSGGAGGGGAGQSILRQAFSVTPGQVIPITIGAAGIGGAVGATGSAGGSTIIGSLITLAGGVGGANGGPSSTTSSFGGLGGSGYPKGCDGTDSASTAGGNATGGAGASTPFGTGGSSVKGNGTAANSGVNASGYGAGGSGAGGVVTNVSAAGAAGGTGTPGLVIIEW